MSNWNIAIKIVLILDSRILSDTSGGGEDILTTPVFDHPLFSPDVVMLFENLETWIQADKLALQIMEDSQINIFMQSVLWTLGGGRRGCCRWTL